MPPAHHPHPPPATPVCGPRPPLSSAHRGRRSCGCGRCRRAAPGPRASLACPRPFHRPRAAAESTTGRHRCCPRPPTSGPVTAPHNSSSRLTCLIGGETTRPKQLFVMVDDLDRHRHLVRIDPDDHALYSAHCAHLVITRTNTDGEAGTATTSRAVPSRATPRHGARRLAVQMRATPTSRWAAAIESHPPNTWPESGQTPILPEVF